MILCQMDIKLFRRENGHLKGILIFVISFLMWYFTDKAVFFYASAIKCPGHIVLPVPLSVIPDSVSAHYLSHTWIFSNEIWYIGLSREYAG